MSGWGISVIKVLAADGTYEVAGWVKGNFGLDYRTFIGDDDKYEGWAITHIPTGYRVGVFTAPFSYASDFVEQLEEAADWSFTDPAEAKIAGADTADIRIKAGNYVQSARQAFFGPLVKVQA